MSRPILNRAPLIIAKAEGAQLVQTQSEFGCIYTVTDHTGATRFKSSRREAATAWLEGYAAGIAAGRAC